MPLPDEELLALVYVWLYADGSCGRFVAIAEDDPERPPVLDVADRRPLIGRDLDECEIDGLYVRITEPLQRSQLAFASKEVSLDLAFEAIHPPFSYHENADGCPAWLADDRFEQAVAVEGELRVGDRTVALDTTAHRDHSWGTRDWSQLHQWTWINAQRGTEEAVNAYTNVVLGERSVNGYLYRDGLVSPLVAADVETAYDDGWVQHASTTTLRDAEGRTAALTCERNSAVRLAFGDAVLINEVGGHGTLDGRSVPVLHEIGWDARYIRRLMERAA
jgi:hypothetical protein